MAAAAASTSSTAEVGTVTSDGYIAFTEGSTTILFKERTEAFYNPVQEFNRDLSVSNLTMFAAQKKAKTGSGIKVLEALAATGLRSIRYAKEIPDLVQVVANDISPVAVDSIKRNAEYNKVPAGLLVTRQGDAAMAMYEARALPLADKYDVVDLDPYGSPMDFLDGAVQAVAEGGMLAVTATDMAVLCGPHSDACYTKYGTMPVKRSFYCHELALRELLIAIEKSANRYRRYIKPLVCLSVDFYVRVFVRVFTGAKEVNDSPAQQSYLFQCSQCDTHMMQPVARKVKPTSAFVAAQMTVPGNCPQCGGRWLIGGPIWSGPIHDQDWVRNLHEWIAARPEPVFSKTKPRLLGVLAVVGEEIPEAPLFYATDCLSQTLHLSTPPRYVVEYAWNKAGYKLSVSHTNPLAIKTNAPLEFVWDFMRCWAKENPGKCKRQDAASVIFAKEPTTVIDLKDVPKPSSSSAAEAKKTPRFLPNPQENWGPGSRAGKKREKVSNEEEATPTKAANKTKKQKKASTPPSK